MKMEPSFEGLRCEEASMHSRKTYLSCGQPATHVVYHPRDKRAYLMCEPDAYHNVKNRGGQLVAGPPI